MSVIRRSRTSMLTLACLVLASHVSAQQTKTLAVRPATGILAGQTAYTNSYAIIIGVGDYAFLPKSSHLDFAARDAGDLRDLLVRSYGFPVENITLLLDEKATRANIETALSMLSDDKVKPTDRVLIYFSGHGQTVTLQDGGQMGFLIPHDAKVDLAHPENRSGYLATCLRMDSLWGYLEASAARHRLLIADACFGGLLIRGKTLKGEKPNRSVISSLLARPALQAMTAGGGSEEAQEDPKLGHSAYTYKLLEELTAQAANPDSVFLASDLAAALKTSVSNLTNGKQTPQFGNYRATEGDFVFISTAPQRLDPRIPSPQDLNRQGRMAEAQKDYKTAFPLYLKAAEAGDPASMNALGACYEKGRGVAKEGAEAAKWYRKAAEAGYVTAMYNLGALYSEGRDITRDDKEALKWIHKAIDVGSREAMAFMGLLHLLGRGVEKNDVEAVTWLRRAADLGSPEGMSTLAFMYESGRGVAKDEDEAVKWYRKAAQLGDPIAIGSLKRLGK